MDVEGLLLFGEHANFFDAGGTDGIDGIHHGAVMGTGVGTEVDDLAGLVLELIADLRPEIGDGWSDSGRGRRGCRG